MLETRVEADWRVSTEGGHVVTCRDRDRPDHYMTIVEFASYEVAMENSDLPETDSSPRGWPSCAWASRASSTSTRSKS